jgi:hypothetical protein
VLRIMVTGVSAFTMLLDMPAFSPVLRLRLKLANCGSVRNGSLTFI